MDRALIFTDLFLTIPLIPICRRRRMGDEKQGDCYRNKHQRYFWNSPSPDIPCTNDVIGRLFFLVFFFFFFFANMEHGFTASYPVGKTDTFANWIMRGRHIGGMNRIWGHVQELKAAMFVCQLKMWQSRHETQQETRGFASLRVRLRVSRCPPIAVAKVMAQNGDRASNTLYKNGVSADSRTHSAWANGASSYCLDDIYTQPF